MLPIILKNPKNDTRLAGQRAGRQHLFGDYSRYSVYPVHTRFDNVEWFVSDAGRIDPETDLPTVIRQASTIEEAVKGLE